MSGKIMSVPGAVLVAFAYLVHTQPYSDLMAVILFAAGAMVWYMDVKTPHEA